uniref:Uncharacterized protein n=1 Tax=Timema genevievae TaxID=629358 RepID=A0A7R9PM63_TIMGE|nr:unnamed protein product [Timema genevievae]
MKKVLMKVLFQLHLFQFKTLDKELAWLLELEERADKIIFTDIEEEKYEIEDKVNSYVDIEISLEEEIKDLKMQVSEYKHQKIPKVKEDLRVAKADLSLEQKRLETLNKENEEYLAKVLKLEEQERNLEEHCRILEKNCKPNEKDLRLIASAKQVPRTSLAVVSSHGVVPTIGAGPGLVLVALVCPPTGIAVPACAVLSENIAACLSGVTLKPVRAGQHAFSVYDHPCWMEAKSQLKFSQSKDMAW